jgi:3-oxoadipate enol-lactonase
METTRLQGSRFAAGTTGTNSRVKVKAVGGSRVTLAYRYYTVNHSDPAVVLLHGLGSAGLDWSMQIAELIHRYRVVALDFPGHGESPPLYSRTTIPELSSKVYRTISSLNTESGILVGHSLGGLTALQMVLDSPEHFKALVLVNAVPRMKISRHSLRQAMGRVPDVLLGRMDRLAEFVASEHFPHKEQDLLRRLAVRRIKSVEQDTYTHMMTAILRFDVRRKLDRIRMPVLVVSGSEDRVFSLAEKKILAEYIPDVTWVEMEHSGHASPQDAPERFNRVMWSFLDQLDGHGDL